MLMFGSGQNNDIERERGAEFQGENEFAMKEAFQSLCVWCEGCFSQYLKYFLLRPTWRHVTCSYDKVTPPRQSPPTPDY